MAPRSQSRRKSAGDRSLPPVTSGPWRRVVTASFNPSAYAAGDTLYAASNCYPLSPGFPSQWAYRPNITRVGTLQLGSGSTRNGQCVYQHTRPDGTIDNLLFAGGKMYALSGTTTTDLTPGAITISTTARIYCTTFAGLLIVTDGVNKPWTYDPATTTAAYIDIDGSATAWVAYGPPVVYGAKLFFILVSKGATTYANRIIWSEEATTTVGYMQAGYTDFWTLSQTSSEPLTCLAATNTALFYFRANSIGAITGAVSATFATTATHDAVSSTVGTKSPASVTVVDDAAIYFLDEFLLQWRIVAGRLDDIGRRALPEPPTDLGAATLSAQSVYLPGWRFVLSDSYSSAPGPQRSVWGVQTGEYYGRWQFPSAHIRAMGMLTTSGVRYMYMIGTSDDAGALGVEGYVYRFRAPSEAVSTIDDSLGTGGGIPDITVPIGADLEYSQSFHMVTAEVYNGGAASVSYGLAVTASSNDGGTAVATSTSPATSNPARVAWGINAHGRDALVQVYLGDTAPLVRFGRIIVHRSILGFSPNGL